MKNLKIGLIIFLLNTSFVLAEENSFIKMASFTYENDSVYGKDSYYSNGLQFYFSTNNKEKNNKLHSYSFGIGQKMFTPYEIEDKNFNPNDRPYAGYLYGFLNKNIFHDNTMDTIGLSLGTTGPNSLAEEVQKDIHSMIKSPEPQGWDYQIDNQILFSLHLKRNMEIFSTNTHQYDWKIFTKLELNLGTPTTSIVPSIEFRYGWNLGNDFLANKITETPQDLILNEGTSYYAFLELMPMAVLYDTFLDEDEVKSGYKTNIEREWFQYQIMLGFTAKYKDFYVKNSNMFFSKEFDKQDKTQIIFSLNVGYLF